MGNGSLLVVFKIVLCSLIGASAAFLLTLQTGLLGGGFGMTDESGFGSLIFGLILGFCVSCLLAMKGKL